MLLLLLLLLLLPLLWSVKGLHSKRRSHQQRTAAATTRVRARVCESVRVCAS